MDAREDYGVPLVITAAPDREIRRQTDWTEPFPEGEWMLHAGLAGDE